MKMKTSNSESTTHNFIHENSLSILMNDLNKHEYFSLIDDNTIIKIKEALKYLYSKKEIFQQDANFPDKNEREFYFEVKKGTKDGMLISGIRWQLPLFSNHFFSPHEATSYTYKVFNKVFKLIPNSKSYQNQGLLYNAMGLFLYHTENALNSYYSNFSISDKVISELSKACHYLEDMNETHHVTNNIAFFTNHKRFELYANLNKDFYKINSAKEFFEIDTLKIGEKQFWGKYNFYMKFINAGYLRNRSGIDALKQVCHWIAEYSACFATGVDDLYSDNKSEGLNPVDLYCGASKEKNVLKSKDWLRGNWALSNDKERWKLNIEQTLKMAQISVASYIFVFLLFIVEPELFNY